MKSYAEIKSRLDAAVAVEYKALQDAKAKLDAARTNLDNAKSEKMELVVQRDELVKTADEKLGGAVDDFAVIRRGVENAESRIADIDKTVTALDARIIPAATHSVVATKSILCTKIENFFAGEKAGVATELNKLLGEIIRKQDEWLTVTDTLFDDYGFSLVAPLARVLPRIEHSRVRQFESGNCIHIAVPKPDVRRTAAEKLRAEPTVEMNAEGQRQASVLRRMFGTKDKADG